MTDRPSEGTILLVEDDAPIRRLIRRALEAEGFRLLEASNGREALFLASDHSEPIGMLITDVVMPCMDGFRLAEQLVESHPETRILFMSGQADRMVAVRGGLKEAGKMFLLKPFTPDQLLQTIRQLLDVEPGQGLSSLTTVSAPGGATS